MVALAEPVTISTQREEYLLFDKDTLPQFLAACELLERMVVLSDKTPLLALDVETTGLDPRRSRLLFVQLYNEAMPPIIFDARGADTLKVGAILKRFAGPEWLKIGHNIQFDLAFLLENYGILFERVYDTQLAEELLTAGLMPPNTKPGLKGVADKYLGVVLDKDLREQFMSMEDEPVSGELLKYMSDDVLVLPGIMKHQSALMNKHDLLRVAKLEFSIVPALVRATHHGVRIDDKRWLKHIVSLAEEETKIEAELQELLNPYLAEWNRARMEEQWPVYVAALADYEAAKAYRTEQAAVFKDNLLREGVSRGDAQKLTNQWKADNPPPKKPVEPSAATADENINLGSPQQLAGALLAMGVPLRKKRGSDSYETDRDALAALAEEYEICKRITEWREYSKMRTAFGEAVTRFMDAGKRLHPEYNQLVSTGRMSCRNPNVQQVPANKLGNELRKCFIAPRGRKLVAADYSQIELRILAELSGEPNLMRAFEEGVDLHSLTASVMFKVDLEEMLRVLDSEPEDEEGKARKQELKELRRKAKAVNFGIPYGQGPGGLSMKERIPMHEAERYIASYFEANPRVKEWLDKNGEASLARNYAETMLGRKRFFPPIYSNNRREYERAKNSHRRQMNNHPIQGTSADITKLAVYKLHQAFKGTTTVPILFVHDEIVVECDEDKAEEVLEILVREMKEAATHFLKTVPVTVEGKISSFWEH